MLENTSSGATPQPSYLPFGHPFVKGDISPVARLKATWTPQGGAESAALPVQTAAATTWGDGSLRFARVAVALPTVAGSGSGTLKLYSEPGAPITALPAGKTAANVLADLRANFPFSVAARNLTRGRETIRVDAPGSGYTGTPTVSYSGGVGGTAPPASVVYTSGGGIAAVMFTAPSTPYTSVPTVAVSGTGMGAALTFVNPPADGSGSWTWRADDHLALYGTTDSRGRVRCELVESGPLCVTFACWGPFTDDAGGASHPHLTVRAWYRCWLNPSTGAIDRVEYLHSLEQGWIGDLAGGSVAADQQVGDFAVKLNGATVAGRSYTRVRVIHHTANPLTTVDGTSASWTTGGSDWTSGAPTLRADLQLAGRQYWRKSGLVPPYDVEYYAASGLSPATDPSPVSYTPGASSAAGKMPVGDKVLDNTGPSERIGLMPTWDIRSFLTDDPGYWRSSIATAFYGMGMPVSIRNPDTGRVPVLVSNSLFAAQANTGMGKNLPSTYYFNNQPAGGYSSSFKLAPRGYSNMLGASYQDPTNNDGAWGGTGSYGASHFPSMAYLAYLRTGQPWFLETIKVHGNQMVMWTGTSGSRVATLPDGTTAEATGICYATGERQEAWTWKGIAQALAIMPDDSLERPYFQALYNNSSAAAERVRAHFAAHSAGFASQGCWTFVGQRLALDGGGHLNFHGSPWMQNFLLMARAFEYLALDRPANTLAFLQHYAKQVQGLAGGSTPARACGAYGAGAYNLVWGWGTSKYDYFADWPSMPTNMENGYTAAFDSTTQATGAILATRMTNTPSGLALQPGDLVMFTLETGNSPNNAPPSPLSPGVWYSIASISGGRAVLSPNADLSGPITSYAATASNVGFVVRIDRAVAQTASAGTSFVQGEGTDDYAAECWMAARLLCAAGVVDPNAPWMTAFESRVLAMSPDWRAKPTWRASKAL